jgi:hypothetical protein
MRCEQCNSELRVRSGGTSTTSGLESRGGRIYLVQYYYCVQHGDQYKKLVPESGEPIIEKL